MSPSAFNTTDLLRLSVLPALRRRGPYASVPAIRRALAEAGSKVQPATVNRYLSVLLKEGAIFDAGRGWYSFLKDRAQLDPEPVAALVAEVKAAFPLARFAAWSTAQVNPWMHHLIGTPTAVLDVEKDAIESAADRLESSGWKVFLNPTGAAARRFAPGPKVVVLRVLHSSAPEASGGLVSVEQVLVELRSEAAELGLMTVAEFQAMASRLVSENRIAMGTALSYAERRLLKATDLFGNQLTANF
jgi:hypothetical protein